MWLPSGGYFIGVLSESGEISEITVQLDRDLDLTPEVELPRPRKFRLIRDGKALAELIEYSSRQFDGNIVGCFIELLADDGTITQAKKKEFQKNLRGVSHAKQH